MTDEIDNTIAEDFKEISERAGRKLQLALINALYKQIKESPLEVPAPTLAVAERMLARWNLVLIELPEEDEMTQEEKQMVEEFEKLNMSMDSNMFTTDAALITASQ